MSFPLVDDAARIKRAQSKVIEPSGKSERSSK